MERKRTKFPKSFMLNQEKMFTGLASTIVQRALYASQLGYSFGTDRDLYTALGYPASITFQQYSNRYKRQDVAKRIVDAPVNGCWRKKPEISEGIEGDQTEFEKAFVDLNKQRKVFHYLQRVDKLAGIGKYAVLLIGFNDGKELKEECTKASEILYLRPYSEANAEIKTWEEDPKNERYGRPKTYTLKVTEANNSGNFKQLEVHRTRILHVSDGLLEDEVYGTPRLECVYNRLQDLEMVSGGSAEMFWRGAFPGYAFTADKDADMTQTAAAMEDEITEYMHGLKRYLKLQGIEAKGLDVQVVDPKGHIDILLDLIAGGVNIPKRILIGSERGELASSQDETNWNNRVDERRTDCVEMWIIREFINRCITVGVLPEPKEGYNVDWPPIHTPSEKDQAEVARAIAEALSKYAAAPGTELVVPKDVFLKKYLGFTQEEIDEMDEMIEKALEEEQKRIEEEDRIRAEEEEKLRLEQESGGGESGPGLGGEEEEE